MKTINILSLVQAKKNLENDNFQNFLKHYDIEIKDEEIEDLGKLIDYILYIIEDMVTLDNFYVGYKIPQIGKEFDLLRFGQNCIINIELKNTSTEEKIFKQLKRNQYYLSFLNKKVYHFTFVSSEKKLYFLNNDTLEEVSGDENNLVTLLQQQKLADIENIDKLFNPSDYLVSPFNNTEKFIERRYFLTQQQEEIKTQTKDIISNNTKANFIALTGGAGTGKTLLTYDIAKDYQNRGQQVLVIHCGNLNEGHNRLNSEFEWEIIPIKDYKDKDLNSYNLIIIDEAQRIRPKQFNYIVEKIKECNGNCIFSYDKVQTLNSCEEDNNIPGKIELISNIENYSLTKKIRTNANIANFIKMLFDRNRNNLSIVDKNSIELNYFAGGNEAKAYSKYIESLGWKFIRFTPSLYNNNYHENFMINADNSHQVIGQEFDNVAVIIDDAFKYNPKAKLQYTKSSYHHPVKMLFQNLTRVRKKLNIIIVNNEEVLTRCLNILG